MSAARTFSRVDPINVGVGADNKPFVKTEEIKDAVAGREHEVLDALGIPSAWRNGKHIHCPYPTHEDADPSWRWDADQARAFCSCGSRPENIFGVAQKMAAIDFATAKIRVAEILGRGDLVHRKNPGCSLVGYATAKRLPADFLAKLGVREVVGKFGKPELEIPYRNEGGQLVTTRRRVKLSGKKHTFSAQGSKAYLYGLDRLKDALAAGFAILVEGESDCQTLWFNVFPALGLPGAGTFNEQRDAPILSRLSTIYAIVEPDPAGESLATRLAKSSIADRVRLVRLGDDIKDPSELWLHCKGDREAFRAELQTALDQAKPCPIAPDATAAPANDTSSSQDEWRTKLILNLHKEPLALESNAMVLMREHPDVVGLFGLDEFYQQPYLMRRPPWAAKSDQTFPRPVRDADLSDLLAWLQQQGVHLHGRAPVRIALASVVRDRTFHPVRDYLNSLVWDRKPRLDNWLTYYCGVTPIENYTASVGRCWMMSGVARIYKPGCIVKYVLVIEGNQDLGKSTALRILGGEWFTDDIETLGTKDSKLQVGNAWIIELAELDSTRLAHINTIKSFISRPVDSFRPPYGEHIIKQERQCVLAATVNPAAPFLHDETGGVRFWPVAATKIDLDALIRDRDQLWAEAVALYKAGQNWWPDTEFDPYAEQEARTETAETDPWFDLVRDWTNPKVEKYFTTAGILHGAIEMPRERMDRKAELRLGKIMRKLGYVSGGVRLTENSNPVRRWHLKVDGNDAT